MDENLNAHDNDNEIQWKLRQEKLFGKTIRYVLTHVDKNGMRTLVDPMQGRYTYATMDEAQKRLDGI